MKMAFIIYRDVLQDRISGMLENTGVDFYTEWENVKGKGHNTDPHLGSRTFPGVNCVRMIAFDSEEQLENVICGIQEMNKTIKMKDDMIRLFQVPLERII
ncbi:MAG: PG0541 family transporter-associated protein [Bacteroidota bacterium]